MGVAVGTPDQKEGPFWTKPSFVEVDGLNTAYRRKGHGETLLFLHGAGMTRAWLPLYDEFAKSFDTIVPEHPGYGDTVMPETLAGFDDLVLHYDAFLRTLGISGRVHLAGHSLGGWIAANLAIHYPERFASVTLMQPMGIRCPEAPSDDPFRWSAEDALAVLFSGVGESYLTYLDGGDPVEDAVRAYEESITLARLAWNPRYDIKLDHRLKRLAATPTTVVGFADDRFIPVVQAERWAALIPGAQYIRLDGANGEPASHLANVQQPAKLAQIVAVAAQRSVK